MNVFIFFTHVDFQPLSLLLTRQRTRTNSIASYLNESRTFRTQTKRLQARVTKKQKKQNFNN